MLEHGLNIDSSKAAKETECPPNKSSRNLSFDAYFSADVETDGPIPGPFSMLSFALVFAGTYDGSTFQRPSDYKQVFYAELCPISDNYEDEALEINRLDRESLKLKGQDPASAMREAANWIRRVSGNATPILAAYPLSFDWTWLYWYFMRFMEYDSPFNHSRCFDMKTAISIVTEMPIAASSRRSLPAELRSRYDHSHHAVSDAVEQADILARIFEYRETTKG